MTKSMKFQLVNILTILIYFLGFTLFQFYFHIFFTEIDGLKEVIPAIYDDLISLAVNLKYENIEKFRKPGREDTSTNTGMYNVHELWIFIICTGHFPHSVLFLLLKVDPLEPSRNKAKRDCFLV